MGKHKTVAHMVASPLTGRLGSVLPIEFDLYPIQSKKPYFDAILGIAYDLIFAQIDGISIF
jgi:hypothetical protein